MNRNRAALLLALAFLAACQGCDGPKTEEPPTRVATSVSLAAEDAERLRQIDIEIAKRAASGLIPKSVLTLPEVDGWVKEDKESLGDDDGFSVSYSHQAGAVATVYQYRNGDDGLLDLSPDGLRRHFLQVKEAVLENSRLYKRSIELRDEGEEESLGGSTSVVHWAQFEVQQDAQITYSDLYLWEQDGAAMKLRVSYRLAADQVVQQWLTAIHNACVEK